MHLFFDPANLTSGSRIIPAKIFFKDVCPKLIFAALRVMGNYPNVHQ